MDRFDLIRSWLDRAGIGLEIGPLHAPIAAKRDGWQVETLDHADTKTLRDRYRGSPDVDASLIEDVDHVSDGRPLPDVIGATGCYDWIIASHVAEHVPDLLAFLIECEALLKSDGRLILALPDKRQCFDALRPASRTGEVLQAHIERRKRHPPGHGFDYLAQAVELGGRYAWDREHTGALRVQYELTAANDLCNALAASDAYLDLHGWVFVPQSLRLIVAELHELGLIGLREELLHDTVGIEFFIVLSRQGAGPGQSRAEMILASARAERDGLTALLDPVVSPHAVMESQGATERSALARAERAQMAVAEAQAEMAAAQAETASARVEATQARSEVAALRASTSWRMTYPLRQLIHLVRGG